MSRRSMTFRSRAGRTAGGHDQRSERQEGYNALLVALIAFVVVATGVSTGEQVRLLVTNHRSDPVMRVDGPKWPPISGKGVPVVIAPPVGAVVRPAPLLESQPPLGLGLTGSSLAHPGMVSPTIPGVDGSLWLEALAQQFAVSTSSDVHWLPMALGGDVLTTQTDKQHLRRGHLLGS